MEQALDRPKSNWQDLVTITQEGSDLAVRVQFSDLARPQYSFEIGRMREGKFLRFMRAFLQNDNGKVTVQPLDTELLKVLVAEAERRIAEDAEQREKVRRASAPEPRRVVTGDERRNGRPNHGRERDDRPRRGRGGDDRRHDHDPWR